MCSIPIQRSCNTKSESHEQEMGALALEKLHKQVLSFLMRRLKSDVLTELPPKVIQDVFVELSPVQVCCLYQTPNSFSAI